MEKIRWDSFLGGIFSLALGGTGVYIAFSGGELSGGLPLLSREKNQLLGQLAIGFGGTVCIALGVWAFTEFFKSVWRPD